MGPADPSISPLPIVTSIEALAFPGARTTTSRYVPDSIPCGRAATRSVGEWLCTSRTDLSMTTVAGCVPNPCP